MSETSIRKFEITPSQYELFRFTVGRPSTLRIRMMATAPVNLVLLDSEDRAEYETGKNETYLYKAAWGRKSELDERVQVTPGTWYLAVEGSTEPSKGRIDVMVR
jgi:hypothetical protein